MSLAREPGCAASFTGESDGAGFLTRGLGGNSSLIPGLYGASTLVEGEWVRVNLGEMGPEIRSGRPESGVEGNPETGCPQDPGPGLGGKLSVGPIQAKASPFLHENSHFVTAITRSDPVDPRCVDLGVLPW